MSGAVVSSIVNVASVVLAFPQSSVAVKITVVLPVAPHSSLKLVWLLVQITELQASLADAPPKLSNHACSCAVFPAPSHSTVSSLASTSITGGVTSVIVINAVVNENKPQSSVAVNVTSTLPVEPQPVFSPPTK